VDKLKISRRQLRKLISEAWIGGSNNPVIKRYFYSKDPYRGFRDVNQVKKSGFNPKPRGLWYACGDDWKEWVKFEMPHWYESYNHLYEIKINPSNILFITSPGQFKIFENQYGYNDRFGELEIDWMKVSSEWAGIEICPYQSEFRMSSSWYYPWDVASGCVWHGEGIISVEDIPFDSDMHGQEY